MNAALIERLERDRQGLARAETPDGCDAYELLSWRIRQLRQEPIEKKSSPK